MKDEVVNCSCSVVSRLLGFSKNSSKFSLLKIPDWLHSPVVPMERFVREKRYQAAQNSHPWSLRTSDQIWKQIWLTCNSHDLASKSVLLVCWVECAVFHLYQARQLVPYLLHLDLATVIHATVTLDYWNSLYAGLPLRLIWKLQLVQHAAAQILKGTQTMAHVQPVVHRLHWLQV